MFSLAACITSFSRMNQPARRHFLVISNLLSIQSLDHVCCVLIVSYQQVLFGNHEPWQWLLLCWRSVASEMSILLCISVSLPIVYCSSQMSSENFFVQWMCDKEIQNYKENHFSLRLCCLVGRTGSSEFPTYRNYKQPYLEFMIY